MSEKTAKKQRGTPFTKDDPRINKDGRPLGSKKEKAFIEYFDEICEEIALKNKMPVEDVKKVIYKVGYAKAKEGNYQFYKDILDRIHGQATAKVEHFGKLEISQILEEVQNE